MQNKQFAGSVTLDALCNDVLRGLERGQWMIVTGWRARLTRFLARMMPGTLNRLTDRKVAAGLRR
jgi:hypothetical protein